MQRYAVIVAGGTGSRFGGNIPKQFSLLAGKPVLFYSIEKFFTAGCEIIVVIPNDFVELWNSLCRELSFDVKHKVAIGGKSRTASVKNGLEKISGKGIVAIHDAARPLISVSLIEKLFEKTLEKGNAVPVIAVQHSLRKVNMQENAAVNRDEYKIIQTPQCFLVEEIKSAYQKFNLNEFSDDASLFEAAGGKIFLVEGEVSNIKITTQHDMLFAEAILGIER